MQEHIKHNISVYGLELGILRIFLSVGRKSENSIPDI